MHTLCFTDGTIVVNGAVVSPARMTQPLVSFSALVREHPPPPTMLPKQKKPDEQPPALQPLAMQGAKVKRAVEYTITQSGPAKKKRRDVKRNVRRRGRRNVGVQAERNHNGLACLGEDVPDTIREALEVNLLGIVHHGGSVAYACQMRASSATLTHWVSFRNKAVPENAHVLDRFFGMQVYPITARTTLEGMYAMTAYRTKETKDAIKAYFDWADTRPACVIVVINGHEYVLSKNYNPPEQITHEVTLQTKLIGTFET